MPKIIFRPSRQNPPRDGILFLNAYERKEGDTFSQGSIDVRFDPGVNDVPGDRWQAISQSEIGLQLIEWKALEEIPETEEISAPATTDLSKLNIENAEKIIEHTSDLALLQQWAEQDSRKTIRNYVNLRIKAIQDGRI